MYIGNQVDVMYTDIRKDFDSVNYQSLKNKYNYFGLKYLR